MENTLPTVDDFYCWHRSRLILLCLFTKSSAAQIKAPNARKSRLANLSASEHYSVWRSERLWMSIRQKLKNTCRIYNKHTETDQMSMKISNCDVMYIQGTPNFFDNDFVARNASYAWFVLLYMYQELSLLSDYKQELQSWNGAPPRIGAVLVLILIVHN